MYLITCKKYFLSYDLLIFLPKNNKKIQKLKQYVINVNKIMKSKANTIEISPETINIL